MNHFVFEQACNKIISTERKRNGIGTLGEKTLHAVLKNYFEPHEDNHEIKIGGYVADIVGENGIIEIQTRSFHKMRTKLERFLEFCDVTVVYPIPAVKYLSWLDLDTGEITKKRKSPRRGKIYDVISELYAIKYTLDNPRMNLCLCMLEIDEIKYLNGWSDNKKRGASRCDQIPVKIVDQILIKNPNDYSIFIPETLPKEFTSLDYAKNAKVNRKIAQTSLNILTYLDLVKRIGKTGNTIIYERNS